MMKHMRLFLSAVLFIVAATVFSLLSTSVYAAQQQSQNQGTKTCGGVDTAVLSCNAQGGNQPLENSAIWNLLLIAINILTGLVVVVAIGGLVYGAIMYASAQDNASQVQEAVGIIRNVIIGLALFVGMYALLQYLIPGGIF